MDPLVAVRHAGLIGLKDKFDVAFACDTDHDRHGIVTEAGLMQPESLSGGVRSITCSRTATGLGGGCGGGQDGGAAAA